MDRSKVYITNAVKHFKWEPATRGKRRIHKKPRASEIAACRPWLEPNWPSLNPKFWFVWVPQRLSRCLDPGFSVTREEGQNPLLATGFQSCCDGTSFLHPSRSRRGGTQNSNASLHSRSGSGRNSRQQRMRPQRSSPAAHPVTYSYFNAGPGDRGRTETRRQHRP